MTVASLGGLSSLGSIQLGGLDYLPRWLATNLPELRPGDVTVENVS